MGRAQASKEASAKAYNQVGGGLKKLHTHSLSNGTALRHQGIMDDRENVGGRSLLYQPFINTANALTSLYKQAAILERDGRDAGLRSAYQHIMQWAARKGRAGESISAADVISLCAGELASLPQPTQSSTATLTPAVSNTPASRTVSNPTPPASLTNHPPPHATDMVLDSSGISPQVSVPPSAYIPRDDGLISDIRKLNVNPRKRQRIEITEAFKSAFRTLDNAPFLLSDDCAFNSLTSPERSVSPRNMQPDAAVTGRHTNSSAARRDSRDNRDGRDGRDGRDNSFNDPGTTNALITRSSRRGHAQDKSRRKQ